MIKIDFETHKLTLQVRIIKFNTQQFSRITKKSKQGLHIHICFTPKLKEKQKNNPRSILTETSIHFQQNQGKAYLYCYYKLEIFSRNMSEEK